MVEKYIKPLFLITALAGLVGCSNITTGNQKYGVSGAAAGSTSANADSNLEHCSSPLGTLAIDDGRNADWFGQFGSATKITSIEPLLRIAVQQSNCFVITSIGNQKTDSRLSNITDKQRNSGEYRAGSKQQKGQRVAADYFLEPHIVIDNSAVGSLAGSLGGLFGNSIISTVASSVQMKASVVTLSLFDIRSSVQIASAEGSATATNYGAALAGFGSSAGGALGGISRTPEGKATVAAFLESYNNMVIALRNYKASEVKGGLGRGGTLKVN